MKTQLSNNILINKSKVQLKATTLYHLLSVLSRRHFQSCRHWVLQINYEKRPMANYKAGRDEENEEEEG